MKKPGYKLIVIEPRYDHTKVITASMVITDHATMPNLTLLQSAVDGYIERVPMKQMWNKRPAQIWCNEEGLIRGLAPNKTFYILTGIKLFGPVAIVQRQPKEGSLT